MVLDVQLPTLLLQCGGQSSAHLLLILQNLNFPFFYESIEHAVVVGVNMLDSDRQEAIIVLTCRSFVETSEKNADRYDNAVAQPFPGSFPAQFRRYSSILRLQKLD